MVSLAVRCLSFVLCLLLSPFAAAQDFPGRPVRIVVPVAPGGGSDLFARALATRLSARLKQAVVVENREGAGGAVGVQYVSRSAPDGYTLTQVGSALPMLAAVNPAITVDVEKDLEPVAMLAQLPMVLVAHPEVPAKAVPELIQLARQKPASMNYASFNIGGPSHFAGEMFKHLAQVDITHIPYKGSAPALQDVLGGRVHFMFDAVSTSIANIRAGKLRPLAVTTDQRSSVLPDVPTMMEQGIAGFDISAWVAILAPARTDPRILDQLNEAINSVLRDPEFAEPLMKQGWQIVARDREYLRTRVSAELRRWREVARAMNMKAQ